MKPLSPHTVRVTFGRSRRLMLSATGESTSTSLLPSLQTMARRVVASCRDSSSRPGRGSPHRRLPDPSDVAIRLSQLATLECRSDRSTRAQHPARSRFGRSVARGPPRAKTNARALVRLPGVARALRATRLWPRGRLRSRPGSSLRRSSAGSSRCSLAPAKPRRNGGAESSPPRQERSCSPPSEGG